MSLEDAIRAIDPSDQLDDVLALPDHLRDALWRVESAGLEPAEAQRADRLRHGRLGDRRRCSRARRSATRLGAPDAGLPRLRAAAVDRARPRGPLLELLGRHRGDARLLRGRRGDRRRALRRDHRRRARRGGPRGRRAGDRRCPAGLQPRHAVGYGFTVACEMAALVGAAPAIRTEIDTAAAHLEERRDALVAARRRDRRPARRHVPLIYGCDLTVPVAYRWKTPDQRERQAARLRAPAARARPQRDRRLERRTATPERFSAVFLDDSDQHPRQRQRAELTAKLIDARGRRGDRGRDRGRDRASSGCSGP